MRGDVDKRLGEMRRLTRWERRITWIALIVVVAMGLFPPWVETIDARGISSIKLAGYQFLFDPPAAKKSAAHGVRIDFPQLGLQGGLVVLVAAGLIFLRRRP